MPPCLVGRMKIRLLLRMADCVEEAARYRVPRGRSQRGKESRQCWNRVGMVNADDHEGKHSLYCPFVAA